MGKSPRLDPISGPAWRDRLRSKRLTLAILVGSGFSWGVSVGYRSLGTFKTGVPETRGKGQRRIVKLCRRIVKFPERIVQLGL